ncbi:hypothetical protein Tco_1363322 [Tanacetum coccineum]
MKRVNTFVDMDTKLVGGSEVREEGSETKEESSSKRAGDELEQEPSKKQKVDDYKETEELKQCMEIISDEGDDVTIEATPLSTKSPTIMYLTFGKMLKNFDREDLEVLWSIVKARFKKIKPVNYMDIFLHLNLKTMFEHHLEDSVWKNKQGTYFYYLLVEKMYPLTEDTLHHMFIDVKLQVDYECEMLKEFDLLKWDPTRAALVTTLPLPSVFNTPPAPQQTTTPIHTPPITTDAPIITTAIPESDALSAVQLIVAKLEKDVSALKNLGDALQKALQKHSEDLIHKHSVKPAPESSKIKTLIVNLEKGYEKSASEILKIKREQVEKQKTLKFTLKSINKAALKEFDQKSVLYQTMHANKSFNRNPANHRLYHALMKASIEDENAMDKGVVDTVKDHKRKHDDNDDDDDEDPPARPNQGKQTKRKRTKESESSKKSSTTKKTPKGKALSKGFKTGKSDSAQEPVEEPTAEVLMDDAGEDVVRDNDQPQDTSETKIAKTPNLEWFTQPTRPPTPDPKWNKRQVVLDQLEQPWFNQMVSDTKDPLTFNDLMATLIDFFKFDQQLYKFKEGDFVNLHLKDIEDMLLLDVKHKLFHLDRSVIVDFIVALCMFTRILILKRRIEELQLERYQMKLNITKPQKTFPEIEFKEPYTPSYDPPGIFYKDLNKQKRVLRADELYKFSNGTLKSVPDEIHHRVLEFHLDYNKEMPKTK